MSRSLQKMLPLITVLVAILAPPTSAAEPSCDYDAGKRILSVTTASKRNFNYAFNQGGAVSGIRDLDLGPETNLIGDSFQGETTDRVIQWTYWNARYLAAPHVSGDKDRRANVTMEGCFDGKHTCEVLDTPKTGKTRTLTFRSRITHWFYSELDRHGRPDFETTSRYEVLDDGSLKLERAVLRRPWTLRDVVVKTWDGKRWLEAETKDTTLVAENLWSRSMTSYFEAWTPLRRTALPQQRHGKGTFDKDGYQFWKPNDLGGWAMAYGDKLAVAVVFGEGESKDSPYKTRVVFNKQDLPEHKLNVLLPGIETDWPNDATLTQTLIFVVGNSEDVMARAKRLSAVVPFPTVHTRSR